MYVCLCKGVTDTQIRDAVIDGADSLADVRRDLGVASNCGCCAKCARQVIKQTKQEIACLDDACQVA
ncbi:(2Fe-2S)-binding protein [Thiohalophilus thiocyanatoxydans]|uniref:Bacterioferritin-associated ferredoxin n=1 Tax=Thiohalophilus thiocyanatoxydans TaxID=381308 RepID=A0A4R8J0B5_9GAMM|nr:(2Fe-2S)-binding protein [Thiohalophilus thiocyanatoxydans]TDY03727.1 bacterioferritin-associated ferredoxin [Thiohalophilus thiocyanatoxydans]